MFTQSGEMEDKIKLKAFLAQGGQGSDDERAADMSGQPGRQSLWRALPFMGFIASEWWAWHEERTMPCYELAAIPDDASELPPYLIDMGPLLALPFGTLDESGVPYNTETKAYPAAYHPTAIAQYALAQWNVYLKTNDEKHKKAFMIQARWLVAHEVNYASDVGGWPIPFRSNSYNTPSSWLSALTQGNGISVLVRAYRISGEDVFLQVARRAVRTFERDILDGGVSVALGDHSVFFEEVAVYPASHILNGYILSLFGLYDYVAVTGDASIAALIERSLSAMHTLIDQFDTGYWSRYDLLGKSPATYFYHDLHSKLLEALASYSGCEHCLALAARWTAYRHSLRCRLCYFVVSHVTRYWDGLRRVGIRGAFFRILKTEGRTVPNNTRVPVAAFSVAHPGPADREIKE